MANSNGNGGGGSSTGGGGGGRGNSYYNCVVLWEKEKKSLLIQFTWANVGCIAAKTSGGTDLGDSGSPAICKK